MKGRSGEEGWWGVKRAMIRLAAAHRVIGRGGTGAYTVPIATRDRTAFGLLLHRVSARRNLNMEDERFASVWYVIHIY